MRTLIIALFSLALVVGCSDDDTNNTKKDSGTTQKDTGTTQKDTGTTQKDVGGTGTGGTCRTWPTSWPASRSSAATCSSRPSR